MPICTSFRNDTSKPIFFKIDSGTFPDCQSNEREFQPGESARGCGTRVLRVYVRKSCFGEPGEYFGGFVLKVPFPIHLTVREEGDFVVLRAANWSKQIERGRWSDDCKEPPAIEFIIPETDITE